MKERGFGTVVVPSLISFQTLFLVVSHFAGRGTTGEDPGGRTREKGGGTRETAGDGKRQRMDRLDVYDVRLGVESLRSCSRNSSEPCKTR